MLLSSRARASWCCALLLAVVGAGCGGDDGGGRAGDAGDAGDVDDAPTAAVSDLPVVAAASAPGTRRVTCEVTTPTGSVTLALDLPDGFRDRGRCTWQRRLGFRPEAPGGPSVVSVGPVGGDPDRTAATAREMYDEERPFAVEDDTDFEGDDTVYDLRYDHDVPVFGATPGDRVSWRCFCDGAPELTRVAQAAGVELRWSAVPELEGQTDAELAAALASAGRAS